MTRPPMQSSHAKSLPPGTAMHCDSLQRALYSKAAAEHLLVLAANARP